MNIIEPSPTAPLGTVEQLPSYRAEQFTSEAAILCRNTAPLVAFALDLLKRRVPCNILGRDLAAGMTALADKLSATSMPDFRDKLLEHREKEVTKLLKKGKQQSAASCADKCDALLTIARNASHPSEIKLILADLFKGGEGVTLSTVHRAKGKEWHTVYILDFETLMPSPYADTAEELQQEHNLIYVAQTRAKLNLRYIESNCFKP